jgi:hypothetical protein
VRAAPEAPPLNAIRVTPADAELTTMDWEVYPEGLTETLLWLKARYANPPLYITENGAAFDDPPPRDGLVEDPRRVAYLRAHIRAAATALEQGVDLRGYCVWSLLDNFEWAEGYSSVSVSIRSIRWTGRAGQGQRALLSRGHPFAGGGGASSVGAAHSRVCSRCSPSRCDSSARCSRRLSESSPSSWSWSASPSRM